MFAIIGAVNFSSSSLKAGAYSDGYYCDNQIDLNYSNLTPVSAIDYSDSFRKFIYINGYSQDPTGHYSNGFYSPFGYAQNESLKYPILAIDTCLYYIYSGESIPNSCCYCPNVSLANGAYSNIYAVNGEIDINYNSSAPEQIAINNPYTGYYFYYTSGISSDANGPFSNGYFCFGQIAYCFSMFIFDYPIQAINDCLYYKYASGEAIITNGPYSNNYFCLGNIDFSYTNLTPQIIINVNLNDPNAAKYAYYECGDATFANGAFSNSFFSLGRLNTSYNSVQCNSFTNGQSFRNSPQLALDTCFWYLYDQGNNAYIAPDGPYFIGYISNGQIDINHNSMTPVLSLDCCVWDNNTRCSSGFLLFCNGCNIGMPQTGPYSNGYFISTFNGCWGTKGTGYSFTSYPQQAIDDSLFYTYFQGNPIIANGQYEDGYTYENGYRI